MIWIDGFEAGFLATSGHFPYLYSPIKQVNMTTALLKNQFEYSIPEELFSIEPGQVAYFVPADGLIDMENLSTLNYFFRCLREAYKDYYLKVIEVLVVSQEHQEQLVLLEVLVVQDLLERQEPQELMVLQELMQLMFCLVIIHRQLYRKIQI